MKMVLYLMGFHVEEGGSDVDIPGIGEENTEQDMRGNSKVCVWK